MKVLLCGINFAPEPMGIGTYTGEMTQWLVSRGHEVRVVTAPPYYPHWKIFEGYGAGRRARGSLFGAQVWRAPLWVPEVPTGRSRVLHLLSFAVASMPAMFRQVMWRPDVVCVIAPAFACAPGGWLVARLSGARAWLHIQDFEVDAAFRLGLISGRFAENSIKAIERWVLRRFDRVSSISGRMVERLVAKGVAAKRTSLFPNWVDVHRVSPLDRPSRYREEPGVPQDAVVALFSGTMGGKQGLELIPLAAAALAKTIPNMVFVVCGDGAVKPDIEAQCAGLPNVRFLPLQPDNRLRELLGLADIHMLPQHPDAADLVMPSKLTGMLASGRPVVATALPGTEIACTVGDCGLVVPPNDQQGFISALTQLASDSALRQALGRRARLIAERSLSRERVLAEFERELSATVGATAVNAPSSGSAMVAMVEKEP